MALNHAEKSDVHSALDARSIRDPAAKALLAMIVDAIPFKIFWKDRELNYGGCNQAFCDDAGFETPIQIAGLSDFDLPWTDEEAEFYRECDRRAMDSNSSQVGIVETQKRTDGGVEWLETSKIPIVDDAGDVVGILGVYHDITETKESEQKAILENKRLEKNLIQASREAGKAEIATGVLHNVGNVMNSVNVSTGIMREVMQKRLHNSLESVVAMLEKQDDLDAFVASDSGGKRLVGFLKKLSEHSAKLLVEFDELLGSIQHVNSVVAAQQSFATSFGVISMVNLSEIVDNSLKIVGEQLSSHRIEVKRFASDDCSMVTDQHKIIQSLVNLYHNAIRAIADLDPEQGLLQVNIEKVGPIQFAISVEDNGIGIPKENITKIFQHGFSTNKESGGHGFGLHHSGLSIAQVGGTIDVESDGIGCGAKFTLTLDCQADATDL